MRVPPLWKIARELKRPIHQLKALPGRASTFLFGHHYYDRFLAKSALDLKGDAAVDSKIAIYLIYPEHGLLKSHLVALHYLRSRGYAPIVVSNVPMRSDELEQIVPLTWQYVERKNFGYDFGGYRDGVLRALKDHKEIDRLVLLNDSAWFPLPGSSDWLEQAEEMQLDLVGAASNFGHPRVEARDFKTIKWDYSTNHRNFHYCSFALMFSGRILADNGFKRFWERLPLTNDKKSTVRRGEVGLTQWVIRKGFTHGCTLDLTNLDIELAGLSSGQLRQAVSATIIPEAPRLSDLRKTLLAKGGSMEEFRDFILTAVSGQGVSYALPVLMHQLKGFAFLKKSPCWLNEQGSNTTIEFAKTLDGELGDIIAEEAMALRLHRAPSFRSVTAAAE